MTPRRLLPAALVLVLAVAACGGDGDEIGKGSPEDREFAQRMNDICKDVAEAGQELGKDETRSIKEIGDLAGAAAPKVADAVKRFEGVQVPATANERTAAEFHTRIAKEAGVVAEGLRELEVAAGKQDQAAMQAAASKVEDAQTERTAALAKQVGAPDCT